MRQYLKSNHIQFEDGVKQGYLVLEGKKIIGYLSESAQVNDYEDFTDSKILPGLIDTHNHGTHGWALMSDTGNEEAEHNVKMYVKALTSEGVTGIFPTPSVNMIKVVSDVAQTDPNGAKILGIHSEGPWLNRVGEKGIDTGHPPVTEEVYTQMFEDGQGLLKLVAIAPEIPDADKAIKYFLSKGITMATAHSNQNYEEAKEAIKNGITVATHLGNVMTGLHHRDIGVLGACITSNNVENELICDGIHISNPMIELMLKIQSPDHFMMISDSTHLAGLPSGKYTLPMLGDGYIVIDDEGFVKTNTGRLMGSSKSVLYGMKNLNKNLGIDLGILSQMASLNVAKTYGFSENKGSIKLNKDADLVIVNDEFEVQATYVEGELVYRKGDTIEINSEFIKEFKLS